MRIDVVDLMSGQPDSNLMTWDSRTSYSVHCICDSHWMLAGTVDGVTTYSLFYLSVGVTSYTNTPTVTYSYSCCGKYLTLYKTEEGKTAVVALYYAGKRVSLPVAIDEGETIQVQCCGDYAVVSRGEWIVEGDDAVNNKKWAAFYHGATLLIEDRRLTSLRCITCGDDTFAIAPIMDEIDLQYGRSIHYSRWHLVPTLTEEDAPALAEWLDAFPLMGVYVAQNGNLVSRNPGAESNGGRDIQEKMPPDPAENPFTPSGGYWYINDRNAAVRYDKQMIANLWVKLSAQSLDDLPAAPAVQCQPKENIYGIEGTNRGRLVISGNNVLSVFDSELGRMDFCASSAGRLR